MKNIIFICKGNICRSPLAEVAAKQYAVHSGAEDLNFTSAATHSYHVGKGADPRSVKIAAERGYDLSGHIVKQVSPLLLDSCDLLLTMDEQNMQALPVHPAASGKCLMLMAYAGAQGVEIPDPYYKDEKAFHDALDLIESGVQSMIRHYKQTGSILITS
jgi:protein-tyrosine phosphatase